MRDLIIIGASGHGKVVADIAEKCGYSNIVFQDDNPHVKKCGLYDVQGPVDIKSIDGQDAIVAIGDALVRRRITENLFSNGVNVAVLIHPDATIGKNVSIGAGTVIMAGAVVNNSATIGTGCIINTCASVDHDSTLGDYVHVAVGAHVCGSVSLGSGTWLGAGSIVSNNILVCDDCIIGAGATVIKDITDPGTYIGTPAKKLIK